MKTFLSLSAVVLMSGLLCSGPAVAQVAPESASLAWTNTATVYDVAIERGSAPQGPFADRAISAPGTVDYTDAGPFLQGEQVCYRLAYQNSVGKGPYSNVACKTFPILAPVESPSSLTVR